MKQEPNVILLHNNQNESRFLDHFPNLSTITNHGNFHWNYDGEVMIMIPEIQKISNLRIITVIYIKYFIRHIYIFIDFFYDF